MKQEAFACKQEKSGFLVVRHSPALIEIVVFPYPYLPHMYLFDFPTHQPGQEAEYCEKVMTVRRTII
jgi:hypothetical protein